MLDHVSIGVNDLPRMRDFYVPVLAEVGLHVIAQSDRAVDFGEQTLCFSLETPVNGEPASAGNGVHFAFHARGRASVRAFHAAALATGGRDAGPPGLRPEYGPTYYGAFVIDPEGNKIEAVTYETAGA